LLRSCLQRYQLKGESRAKSELLSSQLPITPVSSTSNIPDEDDDDDDDGKTRSSNDDDNDDDDRASNRRSVSISSGGGVSVSIR
jgi:hypothetical protein